MRKPTEEELREFRKIDKKIFEKIEHVDMENFQELWLSKREFDKHAAIRIKKGHIKDIDDYIAKIKTAFLNPDDIKWKKYKNQFKEQANRLDRVYYKKGAFWLDIF